MWLIGTIASSIAKAISDLFNRTTSGSLGSADTGQTWQATRGVWSANGTQAVSTDTASTYPLASLPLAANATVSATVSEGTGVAYWVSDNNNWYATVAYHTQSTYSCGCGTCCNSCANSSCGCATYASCVNSNCTCASYATCTYQSGGTCSSGYYCGGTCWSSPGCTGSVVGSATPVYTTGQNSACGCGTYNSCVDSSCGCATYNSCASCANCGSYSCGCSTCTSDAYAMRTLKSVAGTVSTVISDFALTALPVAIKVVTSGTTINEYAYSDSNMATLLNSTTASPTSPTLGTNVGIIKTPAAVTQGTTVDNFSAN